MFCIRKYKKVLNKVHNGKIGICYRYSESWLAAGIRWIIDGSDFSCSLISTYLTNSYNVHTCFEVSVYCFKHFCARCAFFIDTILKYTFHILLWLVTNVWRQLAIFTTLKFHAFMHVITYNKPHACTILSLIKEWILNMFLILFIAQIANVNLHAVRYILGCNLQGY